MSKLYEIYLTLKQNDSKTLYLFKSGLFYIFLDQDARIINELFNLKLTNLNSQIVKCGFPSNSLQKYLNLLNLTKYNIKIIDISNSTVFTIKDYILNSSIKDLLLQISNVNTEHLSISEAYEFINHIKGFSKSILEREYENADKSRFNNL